MKNNVYTHKIIFFVLSFFLISCERQFSYLPSGNNKHIHYEITFIDKEKKINNYKQSYFLKESNKNRSVLVRSDGKVIEYKKKPKSLVLKDVQYLYPGLVDRPKEKLEFERENIVYQMSLEKNKPWDTNDLTTLVVKLGYDRIYRTLLPINIENKLISLNETIKIKDKILKNCLKIEGFGQTSFFPGAPLGKIDITIKKTEWYAPDLGLVKLIREEISDSETMGNVYYEKVINFN
ncbi:MAG: hypothetical protein VW954_05565 [Alphaproteobacteria bacterium]